jgi:hypothetical protein
MSDKLLHIQINANTKEELQDALRMLHSTFGDDGIAAAAPSEDGLSVDALVGGKEDPAPKTRKKSSGKTPDPEPEPKPETVDGSKVEETKPENPVTEMSPEEARADAIARLQKVYAKNPNQMDSIKKLQADYGVTMFTDVPDDKAHAFLADVKMVEAGAS